MNKIELYKRVVLIENYEQESIDGKIIYKKGLEGLAIDFCSDPNFVVVELDSSEYKDNIPAIPVSLLKHI